MRANTLFGSLSGSILPKSKYVAWQGVTQAVNEVGGNQRTLPEVKKKMGRFEIAFKKAPCKAYGNVEGDRGWWSHIHSQSRGREHLHHYRRGSGARCVRGGRHGPFVCRRFRRYVKLSFCLLNNETSNTVVILHIYWCRGTTHKEKGWTWDKTGTSRRTCSSHTCGTSSTRSRICGSTRSRICGSSTCGTSIGASPAITGFLFGPSCQGLI